MFRRVLVANRGEIALRVIRACRELGIETVSVHSTADAEALHVRFADRAICIGPGPSGQSYLNVPAIIAAAEVAGVDAIHPGYGFLSENAHFAEVARKSGFTFIGPTPEAMRLLGDKVTARALMKKAGVPLLPGTEALADSDEARAAARGIGYPVIIKASGGGGGRGMRIVRSEEEMEQAFAAARAEAEAGFKNPSVYLERYLERPRHLEFQVLADHHGTVAFLGERECSIQRRHQKLVEESPSVVISAEVRHQMGELVRRAVSDAGYTNAGTLEFLRDEDGSLYFMEVNTRLQVEHPVTEMVMGVDIVTEQIRIAAGEKLELPANDMQPRGWAIECRINAEDPESFAPSPGLITEYHPPGGSGIRVDSGIYGGFRVPQYYDSLLAKVIAHGPDRKTAIARMQRALGELIVGGIKVNVAFHQRLLATEEFQSGRIDTGFLGRIAQSSGSQGE
ncbi:MAG: acetyl-CoA carboxylase biotin carboxylase subunit [Deltaproteobacteria bacterium]|nr:acetyl-CoA carboxylase biotin carboxylase subunit [Deltaproteobacteria bacterium]